MRSAGAGQKAAKKSAATARTAAAWTNELHIRRAQSPFSAKQGGNQYADKTGY